MTLSSSINEDLDKFLHRTHSHYYPKRSKYLLVFFFDTLRTSCKYVSVKLNSEYD